MQKNSFTKQSRISTHKKLKEEFSHLDIEKILSDLENIELIFKAKK